MPFKNVSALSWWRNLKLCSRTVRAPLAILSSWIFSVNWSKQPGMTRPQHLRVTGTDGYDLGQPPCIQQVTCMLEVGLHQVAEGVAGRCRGLDEQLSAGYGAG